MYNRLNLFPKKSAWQNASGSEASTASVIDQVLPCACDKNKRYRCLLAGALIGGIITYLATRKSTAA